MIGLHKTEKMVDRKLLLSQLANRDFWLELKIVDLACSCKLQFSFLSNSIVTRFGFPFSKDNLDKTSILKIRQWPLRTKPPSVVKEIIHTFIWRYWPILTFFWRIATNIGFFYPGFHVLDSCGASGDKLGPEHRSEGDEEDDLGNFPRACQRSPRLRFLSIRWQHGGVCSSGECSGKKLMKFYEAFVGGQHFWFALKFRTPSTPFRSSTERRSGTKESWFHTGKV